MFGLKGDWSLEVKERYFTLARLLRCRASLVYRLR